MRRLGLIAGVLVIACAAGARAEQAHPADGCLPIATVIYQECTVEIVSKCDWLDPDWRLYGRYVRGELDSSTVREDGVFQRVFAGGDIRRTLDYPKGMLERILADGEGGEQRQDFSAVVESAGGTETTTGTQVIKNLGMARLNLESGPVDVLRLSADSKLSDGSGNNTVRYLDLKSHVLLGFEGSVTFPDRPAATFTDKALTRLLPGDPGFGETTPPIGATCGPAS